MNITQELIRLKEKIDEAKRGKAQAEGRLEGLMEQLKNEFDCSSIEEAKQRKEVLAKEVSQLANKLTQGIESVKEEYFN